jgi:hypothetical protein
MINVGSIRDRWMMDNACLFSFSKLKCHVVMAYDIHYYLFYFLLELLLVPPEKDTC